MKPKQKSSNKFSLATFNENFSIKLNLQKISKSLASRIPLCFIGCRHQVDKKSVEGEEKEVGLRRSIDATSGMFKSS